MIRSPAVAGRFYPADPRALARELDTYTSGAATKTAARACLVPHAGYMYSGHVAGAVYGSIEIPPRCILLGPRHFPYGAPMSILTEGSWATPFGEAPIDSALAEEIARALRGRIGRGLDQIAFFVVPSVVAFLALGDVVVATLYRSGAFGARDVTYVWGVLAGAAVGLLASTSGRLYSSAFYALRNTRTPLNFAAIRVALTVALGWFCALPLPVMLHIDPRWGVAGLTISAGFAGWLEYMLLRHSLHKRIGAVPYSGVLMMKLWGAALVAAAIAFAIKRVLPIHRPVLVGACVLIPYGLIYVVMTSWMGISTFSGALSALRKRK